MPDETKQDVLNDITTMLGMPFRAVSKGSSIPRDVFDEAARQAGVSSAGSMPDVLDRVLDRADHVHVPSTSSTGSTVTLDGLQMLRSALATLGI